jgi:hypothetical protein
MKTFGYPKDLSPPVKLPALPRGASVAKPPVFALRAKPRSPVAILSGRSLRRRLILPVLPHGACWQRRIKKASAQPFARGAGPRILLLHLLPIDFLPMPNAIDSDLLLLFMHRVCVSIQKMQAPSVSFPCERRPIMPNVRGRQVEANGRALGDFQPDSFTCRECPAEAVVRF